MEALRLGSKVRRITMLERDGTTGEMLPVVLFEQKTKKRKVSRAMKPFEQAVRRMVDAQASLGDKYLSRHNRSNRKKRDGWIRDLNLNVVRASEKGLKRLKMNRWLSF
jgi:hypothetical protein